MDPERHFSVERANALLPEVRERLELLREANSHIAGHRERVTSVAAGNGGDPKADEWLDAGRQVAAQLHWFNEEGIVVRDVEQGLIDFPSRREGREIFLCWRLGEDSVAWWHDTSSGFSGRQPL
ncbi:MAG: DUF2203 domain-containing protein [Actinomycetota bacterium]